MNLTDLSTHNCQRNFIELIKQNFPLSYGEVNVPLGFICAAVVIPVIIINNEFHLMLTKRTASVRDHQNQISFPGGVCEDGENSLLETAIREFDEEIGILLTLDCIIGVLQPRETITGYFIAPYVAFLGQQPKMHCNPAEVKKVINTPICWLADPENYSTKPYHRDGIGAHDVIFY
jgi:8-oxo-dGTP pyrophosphatase MutT (NUDIX family)